MGWHSIGFRHAWVAVLCGSAFLSELAEVSALSEKSRSSEHLSASERVSGGIRFYESLEAGFLNFSQIASLKGSAKREESQQSAPVHKLHLSRSGRPRHSKKASEVGTQAIKGLSYKAATQALVGMPKVLVLYSYNEDPGNKANAEFFFKYGYVESPNIKFVFLDNGGDASITLPEGVERIKRANSGFDCCAFKEAAKTFKPSDYAYFVLMNASVRGPFYPGFIDTSTEDWITLLTSEIRGNTKLVGTTVNCRCFEDCPPKPGVHLQSMMLMTDHAGMKIVFDEVLNPLQCDVAPDGEAARLMCIEGYELKMSNVMLDHGYNLRPQTLFWKNHNFQDWDATRKKCSIQGKYSMHARHGGDTYYPQNFFGSDLSPLEVLFFKTNRNVGSARLDYLTTSLTLT